MLFPGYNNNRNPKDLNEEFKKLEGYLDDDLAKETLAKFLRNNLSFTIDLMCGKKLFPFQEAIIRACFSKDFLLVIGGRGLSKSWLAAMWCWLYAIMYPGVKIGILAPSFRQSRVIFEYIEGFASGKLGGLLSQCFTGVVSHKNELYSMPIGSSTIYALPLGTGGKLRGARFNAILVDELLLMPEAIINQVILPFISVNFDPMKRKEVTEQEDDLVLRGLLKEEDRTIFQNPKFIGLSSASFKFEYLYKLYQEYANKIYDPNPLDEQGKKLDTSSYGIVKLSYQVAPKFLYNDETITKFKSQFSEAAFSREFMSQFTDDSGGFFSKRIMDLCTIENGKDPTIEIIGDPQSKYILAIDPSWSKAASSDHFAMCLTRIDEIEKKAYIVHNYAISGGSVQDHVNYIAYILKFFNVVYIIIDNAGSWIIEDCNINNIFKENNLEVEFFNADFDNINYAEGLRISKNSYSLQNKKIVHCQYFSSDWIRNANEKLASNFDHRTIKFSSHPMGAKFEKLMKQEIPIDILIYDPESKNLEGSAKKADFIEHQGEMINMVKSETALIEIKASSTGNLTFNLPSSLKRDNSPTRARRDSYTALLLNSWAVKCYWDITDKEELKETFVPFWIA